METIFTLKAEKEDIDQLEHVNNFRYVKFLEEARVNWYEKCGISLAEFHERNLGTVVYKMEITYLKEAKLGDHLKIITRPGNIGNTSFRLIQNIYNQFNDHITEAKVTLVMFDRVLRKSIKVSDEIAQHF
jgi:YbgC/YbaW family acyl-CoA thioester hydrolase